MLVKYGRLVVDGRGIQSTISSRCFYFDEFGDGKLRVFVENEE